MLAELTTTCIVDAEGRRANMASAMARGARLCVPEQATEKALAIVASGPSAADYVETLRMWDGHIWAINGAYDWLQSHGIAADGFVGLDPEECMVDYLRQPHHATTFYMASICHPSAFDALTGCDVALWHARMDGSMPGSGSYAVGGGPTCVSRAPFLGHMLGYRDIHVFGADGSFSGATHVYGGSPPADATAYSVGGKAYWSWPQMVHQAAAFVRIVDMWERNKLGKLTLHGDGLTQALCRAPVCHDYDEVLKCG